MDKGRFTVATIFACAVGGTLIYFTHQLGPFGSVGAAMIIGLAAHRVTHEALSPSRPNNDQSIVMKRSGGEVIANEMQDVISSLHALKASLKRSPEPTQDHLKTFMNLLERYQQAIDGASEDQVQEGLDQAKACSSLLHEE